LIYTLIFGLFAKNKYLQQKKPIMLFEPINLKNLHAKNRVVMPPMCQYMANEGKANSWHYVHYAARAIGQVGTIIVEATAVEPRGRISPNDLGLWSNDQIEPMKKVVDMCKEHGALVGVQLAHAGRKSRITSEPIVAPSAIAFNSEFPVPHELAVAEISDIARRFAEAAYRARRAGFDFIEIHAAHGYLISEFLSPVTNHRKDFYGENRAQFLKEVLLSVRQVIPADMPVFVRVSGEEYHPEGNHPAEMARLIAPLNDLYDFIHVSSGGIFDKETYDIKPAYQLDFAHRLKESTRKQTIAVGRLENPILANQALLEGKADMIAIGKGLLSNPYWPLHASKVLNIDIDWPEPYIRAKII
jgi:NADPH2 dehydrogenase